MINTLSRILPPLCLVTAIAFGALLPAQAQELKIGFLAPRTGIITQLGTDMVNGFQMYLDEHDGSSAAPRLSSLLRMTRAQSTATCPWPRSLFCRTRWTCSSARCLAQRPMHWRRFQLRKRRSSSVPSPPGTICPSVNPTNFLTPYSPRGSRRSRPMRRAMGLRARL